MCWCSGKKSLIDCRKVAQEDITVFKVVSKPKYHDKYFLSAFQGFMYVIGQKYGMGPELSVLTLDSMFERVRYESFFKIYEGFHSYSKKCIIKNDIDNINAVGIYSPDDKHYIESYFANERPVMIDCIIPKGTVYFENDLGEIVSKCIIPKCKTKIENYYLKYNKLEY